MSKNTCRLHWPCDGDHSPYVRITGPTYGRPNGIIITSGAVNAQEWITYAAAPRPQPFQHPDYASPLPSPLPPRLQGVCVTITR